MPSGRTHLRIEAGLLVGWGALAGLLLAQKRIEPAVVVAFVAAYLFSMVWLSPDLDLARSRAFRRWGVARWLWLPYARLFRHRSVSHHPMFGPLTRLLYLAAIAVGIGLLYVAASGRPIRMAAPSIQITVAVLTGLYLPNLTHILTDRVCSAWRRGTRKRL
jgi:uncharacterized metal-binding protein